MGKLVYGVGINDADYDLFVTAIVDGKRKTLWRCPFYVTWSSMMRRSYSETFHKSNHTYKNCSVIEFWHRFSNFKSWMQKQDWEGKQLDKDILISGNKFYSPDTCVFVSKRVNSFVLEKKANNSDLPVGVCLDKRTGKYSSYIRSVVDSKLIFLGNYNTAEEAHIKWLSFKLEQAKILADEQTDPRVAKALIERYTNYK